MPPTEAVPVRRSRRLHSPAIRIMHWTNAVAMVIMITSGWKIYNDDLIFGWLHFPDTVTADPYAQHGLLAVFDNVQTARLVHFLCMAATVGFVAVHLTLALLVPHTLVAMVTPAQCCRSSARRCPN